MRVARVFAVGLLLLGGCARAKVAPKWFGDLLDIPIANATPKQPMWNGAADLDTVRRSPANAFRDWQLHGDPVAAMREVAVWMVDHDGILSGVLCTQHPSFAGQVRLSWNDSSATYTAVVQGDILSVGLTQAGPTPWRPWDGTPGRVDDSCAQGYRDIADVFPTAAEAGIDVVDPEGGG